MKLSPQRKRAYRMSARAESAARTRRRILATAIDLFGARPYDEVSLADVADGAGVTVQTVLRQFGSKDGLTEAASAMALEDVRSARWTTEPGDVEGALAALVEHYEEWGDRTIRFLAQEERSTAMRRVTDAGRALHHQWVEHVFAPLLAAARGAARVRLRARLIASTDVYVWKILRRDLRLGLEDATRTLRELVTAITA